MPEVPLTILHTNDFHGVLDEARAARIRAMKDESTLYFDSGDCIRSGNLAVPTKPEKAWELLAAAGCDAGTLGNRETHIVPAAFKAKLRGHVHPLLCGNLRDKAGRMPLPGKLVLERAGYRVGVIGVMVPMVTEKMASRAASAYLWEPPIETAVALARKVRPECDVLVALTHIGNRQDRLLAEACPEVDVVLGGHSHTVLEAPEKVGRTWVCQGGSHGRFVGRYAWDGSTLTGGLVPLV